MSNLVNFTFDELHIDQTASYSKTLTEKDLVLFAVVSGDANPLHLDAEFAASTPFKERIAHGAWTSSLISAAMAQQLPGPGSIYVSQEISFRLPVRLGDTVTIKLVVTDKKTRGNRITINTSAVNQHGKTIANGIAVVIAPTEKLQLTAAELPTITIT